MTTADDEQQGYGAALRELESILDELEDDDVDVDVLADRVERAAELLRFCRDRIAGAKLQVERIVDELDAAAPTPASAAPEDDSGG
jgi:exodeoxyribonuclease VII small subunit